MGFTEKNKHMIKGYILLFSSTIKLININLIYYPVDARPPNIEKRRKSNHDEYVGSGVNHETNKQSNKQSNKQTIKQTTCLNKASVHQI